MNRAKRRSEADKAKKRVQNLWPWNQYDPDARAIGILAKHSNRCSGKCMCKTNHKHMKHSDKKRQLADD